MRKILRVKGKVIIMKNKKFFLIGFISFLLDIVSKIIVMNVLAVDKSFVVINNFFSLTLVKNTGVAFSLFEGRVSFVVIVTLVFIIWLFKELCEREVPTISQVFYGLILGGALGNLLDRIIYGYVIDFLDFNIFGHSYPVFNIADTFIVVGIIGVLCLEIKKESSGKNEVKSR